MSMPEPIRWIFWAILIIIVVFFIVWLFDRFAGHLFILKAALEGNPLHIAALGLKLPF
jgi:capsule polysaccharide export protein KpsE/RkpR